MRRRRPVPAGGVFGNVRTSGHLLGAIALETGRPVETAPTAEDSDYRLPNDANLEWNEGLFKTGKSVQLRGWKISWQEDLGVVAFNAQMGEQLNSRGAVLEFGTRFKDGVFTLGAEKQHEEAQVQIKGGWLLPYKNTLDLDEYEQQRSVVAISNKFFVPFFAGCPHIKDVVDAVKQALCDNMPEYLDKKLEPCELTFFYGVSRASCTQWHSDSAEHDNTVLELTTLTLLGHGCTSMCIAGKQETWLKQPFDTVVFDPMLIHRSGLTYPHVVKLSIHWKLRSSVATAMPVGTGQAGPSGVKPEHTPEQLALMKKAAEVDAKMEALEGRDDAEAEQERKRLVEELAVENEPDKNEVKNKVKNEDQTEVESEDQTKVENEDEKEDEAEVESEDKKEDEAVVESVDLTEVKNEDKNKDKNEDQTEVESEVRDGDFELHVGVDGVVRTYEYRHISANVMTCLIRPPLPRAPTRENEPDPQAKPPSPNKPEVKVKKETKSPGKAKAEDDSPSPAKRPKRNQMNSR